MRIKGALRRHLRSSRGTGRGEDSKFFPRQDHTAVLLQSERTSMPDEQPSLQASAFCGRRYHLGCSIVDRLQFASRLEANRASRLD